MLNKFSRVIGLSLVCLWYATTGWAQQEQPETSDPGQAVENSEAETGQTKKAVGQSEPKSTPPIKRFTPTEKIHADDAVSFPVDI